MAATAAAGAGAVRAAASVDEFAAAVGSAPGLAALFFWADFHEASRPGGQMDVVFTQLATAHPDVTFIKIEAEALPEVSEKYEISAVPTFVFLAGGTVLGRQEGANAPLLATNVGKFKARSTAGAAASAGGSKGAASAKALNERLRKLTHTARVMVFMKGTPQHPECKFTRRVVELLAAAKVKYASFNILEDNAVRQGLKTFSNWPSFPQVYVAGEFIGGHDVLVELAEDDETLPSLQPPKESEEALNARIKKLTHKAEVVLFMKGSPDHPRCKFSRRAVQLLREGGVTFDHFDIFTDEAVRQGIKKYSNWPSFPQLYVRGNLIGGGDIIAEMAEEGDLQEQLGVGEAALNKRIASIIARAPVVMFMKGTPAHPECGFSRQAVALMAATGVAYDTFNILEDPDVRQGIKKYSNWPTFPQLYVKNTLIGGIDIMKELAADDELADALA